MNKIMNKENLLKMAAHIETVPQEKFTMAWYRDKFHDDSPACNSIGCVIGHCTVIDNPANLPTHYGSIDFGRWSEQFTGLTVSSPEWSWCFDGEWESVDDTPAGAAKRIRWLLENGLPKNWREQMDGEAPLCYEDETIDEVDGITGVGR